MRLLREGARHELRAAAPRRAGLQQHIDRHELRHGQQGHAVVGRHVAALHAAHDTRKGLNAATQASREAFEA